MPITNQREFLMLLERLVEALEENNRLLQVSVNQRLEETPRAPEKKRYVRKSSKKYDYGKIMALYNAGWTYKKIAEEIGCGHSLVGKVVAKYADCKQN